MVTSPTHYERLFGIIGKKVAQHPGKIVMMFAIIALFMLIPISHIEMEANMSKFYPDNEFRDAKFRIRAEFNTTTPVILIVEANSGNILNRDLYVIIPCFSGIYI